MTKARVGEKQRKIVLKRAQGACEYCRCPVRYSVQPFSIEHVLPIAKGGSSSLKNLALACQGCNGHKHTEALHLNREGLQSSPLALSRREHPPPDPDAEE